MAQDFRSYHSAIQELLAHDSWARLGESERIEDIVEKVREHHRELADAGALPALVFIQLSGRVTDRDALLQHLREQDRLTDPADDEDHHDTGLLQDALLLSVEYARDDEDDAPVWISSIPRTRVTDGGEVLIEVPLQVDAVGLRRHRATDDLERLVSALITEFAEETPGVELMDVGVERVG